MGKKFDDFVTKLDEEAKKEKKGLNPQERIDLFTLSVYGLYNDIDNWLKDGIERGKIQTGVVPITITEEALGSYSIEEKWIQIGNARLTLQPIGTILIGTRARVDMTYKDRSVMIIIAGENITSPSDMISIRVNGERERKEKDPGKSIWKYVKKNNRMSYVSLNKETFEGIIMSLINGDC